MGWKTIPCTSTIVHTLYLFSLNKNAISLSLFLILNCSDREIGSTRGKPPRTVALEAGLRLYPN